MSEQQFKPLDLVRLTPVEGPTREDIEAEFSMPLTDSLFCGEFIVESNDEHRTYKQTTGSHLQALAWLRFLANQHHDLKFRVVQVKTGWKSYRDLPMVPGPVQALEDMSTVLEGMEE